MVMKIENDFFPVIAGDLGSSVDTANRYQSQLEEFTPMFKVGFILFLDYWLGYEDRTRIFLSKFGWLLG